MKILVDRTSNERKLTYQDLIVLQKNIEPKPALILAEIEPVITCGRRSSESDFLKQRNAIEENGISFLEVDRGGKTTYHGPGQLMIFPCGTLDQWVGDPMGVRTFVNGLLKCGQMYFEMKGLKTEIHLGAEAGLYDVTGAKAGSVGVSIKRTGVQHGLCINLCRTNQSFYGIRPCGLDVPVAFLSDTFEDWKTIENDFRKIIAKIFTKSNS